MSGEWAGSFFLIFFYVAFYIHENINKKVKLVVTYKGSYFFPVIIFKSGHSYSSWPPCSGNGPTSSLLPGRKSLCIIGPSHHGTTSRDTTNRVGRTLGLVTEESWRLIQSGQLQHVDCNYTVYTKMDWIYSQRCTVLFRAVRGSHFPIAISLAMFWIFLTIEKAGEGD